MANLLVACPTCGHEITVPDTAMGKRGKCPVCTVIFEVTTANSHPVMEVPQVPIQAIGAGDIPMPTLDLGGTTLSDIGVDLKATTLSDIGIDLDKATIPDIGVSLGGSGGQNAATTQPAPATARPKPKVMARIASMDALRGYAIFGMILVDAMGHFDMMPSFLHHHKDKYSYADTIAPLFVFVVGMGYRLSLVRRIEIDGGWDARIAALKRYATLFIVAVMFYGPNYRIDWWDALTDIAIAGIITLPFVDKSIGTRMVVAWSYVGIYMLILMTTPYGDWLFHKSMNGGPLGNLMSGFAMLMGTVAYDFLDEGDHQKIMRWVPAIGLGLIALSFITFKMIPSDFAPYAQEYGPYWAFAARWKAAPVEFLSIGLAWLTFLAFYWICDVNEYEMPVLPILGENPLVIYLIQYSLFSINEGYVEPTNTSTDFLYGILLFLAVFGFCYAAARRLHNQGYVIKL